MSPRDRLHQAIHSTDHKVLILELAKRLKNEGMSQREMYNLFASVQAELTGEEECYDSLVDAMDLIHGGAWAKGIGLFDSVLTTDTLDGQHR